MYVYKHISIYARESSYIAYIVPNYRYTWLTIIIIISALVAYVGRGEGIRVYLDAKDIYVRTYYRKRSKIHN